nr:MAG TPA: hypothetical protein [Caudoviricetes sp.]
MIIRSLIDRFIRLGNYCTIKTLLRRQFVLWLKLAHLMDKPCCSMMVLDYIFQLSIAI